VQSWFTDNAFQYRNDNAIKIRGRPHVAAYIRGNVFPHEGLEDDWGDDAIALQTTQNVHIGSSNIIETDTYGRYGVCDFDADGIDDLFLATRAGFWFSSFGEFPWWYLGPQKDKLGDIRLGYFDADERCDVLAEDRGAWVISSGGTGRWHPIGAFGARLADVAFGQFDPNKRDHRPGVTRRTTHAFLRGADGQWFVNSLAQPDWQPVGIRRLHRRRRDRRAFGRWGPVGDFGKRPRALAAHKPAPRRCGEIAIHRRSQPQQHRRPDPAGGHRRLRGRDRCGQADLVCLGRRTRPVAPAEDL
jgi:hypothetical protein